LELHAWFNPFRAHHTKARSPVSASHISKTHPQWVKSYGPELWLDPGEEGVHDYSCQVIIDVVKRYDIDGVHLDDYFYPYPEKNARAEMLPFPDNTSWQRYRAGGGNFTREEWRRDNVDRFILRLYQAIKAEKRFVKFGISPFGIWRPGFPEQIKGFDAYHQLFADSRKWLAEGWLDYFTPQLYWSIEPKEQSYPVLLKWWMEQNLQHRHLWPGDAPSRIGPNRAAGEIIAEIRLTRRQPGASGNIHWSMRTLEQNRGGITDALAKEVYNEPALVPASPWLDPVPPEPPNLAVEHERGSGTKLAWQPTGSKTVQLWVLQTQASNTWTTTVFSAKDRSCLNNSNFHAIALTAIDRCGNASRPTVLERISQSVP